LKILGFQENVMDNEFTKNLRQEIVKWACMLDHLDCKIVAYHKLHHYLQNLKNYPYYFFKYNLFLITNSSNLQHEKLFVQIQKK